MGCRDHGGQLGLHRIKARITHQTHDGQADGITDFPAGNECVSAADFPQMCGRKHHIFIIVADDRQIMAVVRNR